MPPSASSNFNGTVVNYTVAKIGIRDINLSGTEYIYSYNT